MQDFTNKRYEEADFANTRFHGVNFSGVRITNAWLFNTEVSGTVFGLTVNGVDVGPYVEDQLNQRHPERLLLAPFDPDGMRRAWEVIEEFAAATLERARALPPEQLDVSVDTEFTYLETLRHLVFCIDRWITDPVLGEADPFHPLGMPNPPHSEHTRSHFDVDAKPSLDEVLAIRRGRMDRVAAVVRDADQDALQRQVVNPNGGMTMVMSCLHVVFRDEWWHNQWANRDMAILEAGLA